MAVRRIAVKLVAPRGSKRVTTGSINFINPSRSETEMRLTKFHLMKFTVDTNISSRIHRLSTDLGLHTDARHI